MAEIAGWYGRLTLVAEGHLDRAEDIEAENPVGAEEARRQALEWRAMAAWFLENADKLPSLPDLSDALDLTGVVGTELRLDR